MDVSKLIEQYKSEDELKIFIASQYKQIIQLSKKVKESEEKIAELTKRLKDADKREILSGSTNLSTPAIVGPGVKLLDDAKTISQVQLKMLKDQSFERELTLDETKRVEIFNKILNTEIPEKKEKPLKADAKVLSGQDLLKLVEGVGEGS